MTTNKHIKIKGFDLNHKDTYRITLEGTFWGVYVDKLDHSVLFMKSVIHPDSVDKFEIEHKNGKSELYLHYNTNFGPRTKYIGETEYQQTAEDWVSTVNQFYENRRNNQKSG